MDEIKEKVLKIGLPIGVVGLIFGVVIKRSSERRLKKMNKDEIKSEVKVNEDLMVKIREARGEEVVESKTKIDELYEALSSYESHKPGLTQAEKRELTNRFGGMSPDEINFILDLIPVEYCMGRINRELTRAHEFEDKVKSAMAGLK